MVSWGAFEEAAPPLAAIARQRFEDAGLILLGTLRRSGGPRISPVEPLLLDGRLYLGMMWRSMKALDLRRDPRCVVHSIVTSAEATEGDVKVYGRAVEVDDPGERRRYGDALFARIGWRPSGDFHLFVVDVEEVGFFRVDKEDAGGVHRTWHWRAGQVLGELARRPGTA
jgi:hypothetical protein